MLTTVLVYYIICSSFAFHWRDRKYSLSRIENGTLDNVSGCSAHIDAHPWNCILFFVWLVTKIMDFIAYYRDVFSSPLCLPGVFSTPDCHQYFVFHYWNINIYSFFFLRPEILFQENIIDDFICIISCFVFNLSFY